MAYEAKVALAALKGDKTLAELSEKFDVHSSQIVYVSEARQQLTNYFAFYNARWPHSSLGGMTPDTACFGKLEMKSAA